jgi:prepilin-type processing-associated H-X9-DG protein
MSASSTAAVEPVRFSLDADPADRQLDRLLACMGLIEDANPIFKNSPGVTGLGVLLALPASLGSGILTVAREVYGSLGPAFYGLRTTLVTFLLMALLRIKRTEGLKEHSPEQLGRLLGLDRAPETKTLRRKLSRLAALGRAKEFARELARHRVQTHGQAMGFLYVDGHVRVYHGKRRLPKAYVTQRRMPLPASTDYWVNDQEGDPLFVVNTEANRKLTEVLLGVLAEVKPLLGDRRLTVVFDRGGWSPKLFKELIGRRFDFLTYRKGRIRPVPRRCFVWHEAVLDGRRVQYCLADRTVIVGRGKTRLKLRQVTRLSDDGTHQTHILTSRSDLPGIEVAYRMFERWRQENYFKYMEAEFALDALVDYGIEAADATRDVPNPVRQKLDAELCLAKARLTELEAKYGVEAMHNEEAERRTMRGFKIANAVLQREIRQTLKRVLDLEQRRAKVPRRVPVGKINPGEVLKLATEKKLLTDLLKMVAYQAEGDLLRLVGDHYCRVDDEGRTLIQEMLFTTGDIEVTGRNLRINLSCLSAPHRTQALEALCRQLTEKNTKFPGSDLVMSFSVNPAPTPSMAFPGGKPSRAEKADKSEEG